VAFASKYRNEDRVCICYFGDGAMNQGSMHEAFNMASLWKLPVIYVCENNLVAMGTQLERSSCVQDLTIRGGTAYGIPGYSIDGNDIELMAKTTREAADRARAGDGPTFIEAKTYRFKGHSISDPAKYRTQEELEEALEKDPIRIYLDQLKERGWVTDDDLVWVRRSGLLWEPAGRLWDEVKAEIDESIEFAEESEEPTADALYQDITVAPHIPQE
jgi:pyruvate dehydrogenase E1 component alpha subunit